LKNQNPKLSKTNLPKVKLYSLKVPLAYPEKLNTALGKSPILPSKRIAVSSRADRRSLNPIIASNRVNTLK